MPVRELTPPREWPSLGWGVIDWIETRLRHGPGDVQGAVIELGDEWSQIICDLYRIYPQGHERTGQRVVTYGLVSLPKGWAKSEVAGMLVCAEFAGPVRFDRWAPDGTPIGKPVTYPFIRCLATEEGQTGNTYLNVVTMLEWAKEQFPDEFAGVDIGITRIHRNAGKDGEIRPCSAGASSKDGGKESFIVADEPHLYVLPELRAMHAMCRRNARKRATAQPWMLATTTMFAPGQRSVAEELYAEAGSLLAAGERTAFGFYFHHREGSITAESWDDDAAQLASLTEAFAGVEEWHDLALILSDDIRAPGTAVADAARYWHNQEWKVEAKAVDLAKWDRLADPERTVEDGEVITLGFDGSIQGQTADDTVLVGCVVGEIPHLFLVQAWTRPYYVGADYVVDRKSVDRGVRSAAARWQVRRMACDPPGWPEAIHRWETELGEHNGEPVVTEFHTNKPTRMGPAIDRFLEMLDMGAFTHDGSAELREYAGNALLTTARRSSLPALIKTTRARKIDGLIAAIIALNEACLLPTDSLPDLADNVW